MFRAHKEYTRTMYYCNDCLFLTYNLQKVDTSLETVPASSYQLKGNNRTRCEICSKFLIKTPERRQWRRSGVFILNFEHILHFVLVFLLLTLNI